jgi:hypothetical protein
MRAAQTQEQGVRNFAPQMNGARSNRIKLGFLISPENAKNNQNT